MKRSTVKSFLAGIVIGLACLSVALVMPACSTGKALGGLISAIGDDITTASTGVENQIKETP